MRAETNQRRSEYEYLSILADSRSSQHYPKVFSLEESSFFAPKVKACGLSVKSAGFCRAAIFSAALSCRYHIVVDALFIGIIERGIAACSEKRRIFRTGVCRILPLGTRSFGISFSQTCMNLRSRV